MKSRPLLKQLARLRETAADLAKPGPADLERRRAKAMHAACQAFCDALNGTWDLLPEEERERLHAAYPAVKLAHDGQHEPPRTEPPPDPDGPGPHPPRPLPDVARDWCLDLIVTRTVPRLPQVQPLPLWKTFESYFIYNSTTWMCAHPACRWPWCAPVAGPVGPCPVCGGVETWPRARIWERRELCPPPGEQGDY